MSLTISWPKLGLEHRDLRRLYWRQRPRSAGKLAVCCQGPRSQWPRIRREVSSSTIRIAPGPKDCQVIKALEILPCAGNSIAIEDATTKVLAYIVLPPKAREQELKGKCDVLVFGAGTAAPPRAYLRTFEHLAREGIVVICPITDQAAAVRVGWEVHLQLFKDAVQAQAQSTSWWTEITIRLEVIVVHFGWLPINPFPLFHSILCICCEKLLDFRALEDRLQSALQDRVKLEMYDCVNFAVKGCRKGGSEGADIVRSWLAPEEHLQIFTMGHSLGGSAAAYVARTWNLQGRMRPPVRAVMTAGARCSDVVDDLSAELTFGKLEDVAALVVGGSYDLPVFAPPALQKRYFQLLAEVPTSAVHVNIHRATHEGFEHDLHVFSRVPKLPCLTALASAFYWLVFRGRAQLPVIVQISFLDLLSRMWVDFLRPGEFSTVKLLNWGVRRVSLGPRWDFQTTADVRLEEAVFSVGVSNSGLATFGGQAHVTLKRRGVLVDESVAAWDLSRRRSKLNINFLCDSMPSKQFQLSISYYLSVDLEVFEQGRTPLHLPLIICLNGCRFTPVDAVVANDFVYGTWVMGVNQSAAVNRLGPEYELEITKTNEADFWIRSIVLEFAPGNAGISRMFSSVSDFYVRKGRRW